MTPRLVDDEESLEDVTVRLAGEEGMSVMMSIVDVIVVTPGTHVVAVPPSSIGMTSIPELTDTLTVVIVDNIFKF